MACWIFLQVEYDTRTSSAKANISSAEKKFAAASKTSGSEIFQFFLLIKILNVNTHRYRDLLPPTLFSLKNDPKNLQIIFALKYHRPKYMPS
jgi:hypothetical protein